MPCIVKKIKQLLLLLKLLIEYTKFYFSSISYEPYRLSLMIISNVIYNDK